MEPQLTCPDGLVYDDAAHSYLLDGKPAPGVSTIIKIIDPDQYAGISEEVLRRAAERGKGSHAMIALDVRGQLDYSTMDDPDLVDNWEAWDRFRQEYGFDCKYSERCVASRTHCFAGTLDLAGVLRHHKRKPGMWLVDIKRTAALSGLVAAQTAGYSLGAQECLPDWDPATPRGCLWLQGKTYRFIEYPRASDRTAFIAARSILNYRTTYL